MKNAELFAKKRHAGMTKKDGVTAYSKHLDDVINRLKGLGIINKEVLCAAWLHDTIESTDTSFEEVFEKFGSKVAVTVLSLSKDKSLPKKQREQVYIKQLREASIEAKIIKLCDISDNLSNLKNNDVSKSKKRRNAKQMRQYIMALKDDLVENKEVYPQTASLLESINQILKQLGQRTVLF